MTRLGQTALAVLLWAAAVSFVFASEKRGDNDERGDREHAAALQETRARTIDELDPSDIPTVMHALQTAARLALTSKDIAPQLTNISEIIDGVRRYTDAPNAPRGVRTAGLVDATVHLNQVEPVNQQTMGDIRAMYGRLRARACRYLAPDVVDALLADALMFMTSTDPRVSSEPPTAAYTSEQMPGATADTFRLIREVAVEGYNRACAPRVESIETFDQYVTAFVAMRNVLVERRRDNERKARQRAPKPGSASVMDTYQQQRQALQFFQQQLQTSAGSAHYLGDTLLDPYGLGPLYGLAFPPQAPPRNPLDPYGADLWGAMNAPPQSLQGSPFSFASNTGASGVVKNWSGEESFASQQPSSGHHFYQGAFRPIASKQSGSHRSTGSPAPPTYGHPMVDPQVIEYMRTAGNFDEETFAELLLTAEGRELLMAQYNILRDNNHES